MATNTQTPCRTVLINESNLSTGIVHKETKLIFSGYYWHKIYVQNALKYNRDFVLRTLMNTVHRLDFIPVCYTVENENVCFLLKNCGAAISELCRLNLIVPYPDKSKNLPPIAILLCYAYAAELKVEIQPNIVQIIKKRYNSATKTLNLDAFHKDPELIEFCPLSQPKLMFFVLHLSKEHDVETLKLSNNDIELLKPLKAVIDKGFKKLSALDLRRNNIKHVMQLAILKSFPITDLNLDENPLCENFSEHEYVKIIRENCPKIQKIDGCRVPPPKMLSLRRNYLCDLNAQDFVDQFLEHYFTIYDSPNRVILEGMYQKESMFSLSCSFLTGYTSFVNAKLEDYQKVSRNINKISDMSKSMDSLYIGSREIAKLIASLPTCEHDPYTFTIDVIYYTDTNIIFTVTGVFREAGKSLAESDRIYGFSRTFVMSASLNHEYNIVNEMLYVSNATTSQQQRAFKVNRISRPQYIPIPVAKTEAERCEMVEAFSLITNLKPEWASKCLQEVKFNMKQGLNLFLTLFKAERLPSKAFRVKDDSQSNRYTTTYSDQFQQNGFGNYNTILEAAEPNRVPSGEIEENFTEISAQGPKQSEISLPQTGEDPIISAALNMPESLTRDEIKMKLESASLRILEAHTNSLKYYKLLGKEFYKYNFLSEARKFLADSMERIPKDMGEEIYSIYTLYEVQYGDLNVAESMVLITADTYPVDKTSRFIGEYIAKVNTEFARKMFEATISSSLPKVKKRAILLAYKQFEQKFGNVENELYVESIIKRFEENKQETPKKPLPHEPMVAHEDIIEEKEMEKLSEDFLIFRRKLLEKADLLPITYHRELENIEYLPNDPTIFSVCSEILNKYPGEYAITKGICDKYYQCKVKKRLKIIKQVIGTMRLGMAGVILKRIYQTKCSLILEPLPTTIMKLLNFVLQTDNAGLLHLFEELYDQKVLLSSFFLNNMNSGMPDSKLKIMIFIQKTFARIHGNREHYELAREHAKNKNIATDPFYPNEVLDWPQANNFRNWYTQIPRGSMEASEALKFIEDFKDKFEALVEGTRALYYHYGSNLNPHRNSLYDPDHSDKYQIAVATFEGKFGVPEAGLNKLKKMTYDVNVACAFMDVYVKSKDIQMAKDELNKAMDRIFIISNPDFQETLYNYHLEWLHTDKVDLFIE